MIYPIVKFGDPVLEQRGETVQEFDTPELHKLLEDMFESMYASKGVGLAAPADRHLPPHRGDRSLRWARTRPRSWSSSTRRSFAAKASW